LVLVYNNVWFSVHKSWHKCSHIMDGISAHKIDFSVSTSCH